MVQQPEKKCMLDTKTKSMSEYLSVDEVKWVGEPTTWVSEYITGHEIADGGIQRMSLTKLTLKLPNSSKYVWLTDSKVSHKYYQR